MTRTQDLRRAYKEGYDIALWAVDVALGVAGIDGARPVVKVVQAQRDAFAEQFEERSTPQHSSQSAEKAQTPDSEGGSS